MTKTTFVIKIIKMLCSSCTFTDKITLRDFSSDFFKEDICPIQFRKKQRNKGFSRSYLHSLRLTLEKHILPVFGDIYINEIDSKDIDDFVINMYTKQKYSGRWVNYTLLSFRIVLSEAQRNQLIQNNPARDVLYLKEIHKKKGILTTEEANLLLDKKHWYNDIFYMFNKTGRYTGMRLGEIQALNNSDIKHENGIDYISVTKSYERINGLKSTKTNRNRIVPIPSWFAKELKEFNPDQKFMFSRNGNAPYKISIICYRFRDALNSIGISEEERKERNITFHSWRHRYVSVLNGTIPFEQLKMIVGHSQKSTTDLYTHQIIGKTKRILSAKFYENIHDR